MACPGACIAVSHLRSCAAAGGHCDWNAALLVWLLLGRWTEGPSLPTSAEQDEFAAASNLHIGSGKGQPRLARIGVCLSGKPKDRLARLPTKCTGGKFDISIPLQSGV